MTEYILKDYHEPLVIRYGEHNNSIQVTHEALLTKQAYTLAQMWDSYIKWGEDLWVSIDAETPKAIMIELGAKLYWVPKSLIKKVRLMKVM